ncbi:uncharacterized protein LOC129744591 [Uranotaenia lowii]|uniref:uncharacterized protein LOC129744591 n=1 Tax=Uranotaenia lowii TaxID=190385 RepID=UPI00247A1AA5|nr:uncharacterized protein LOC129744591 [Uranotaenia lowii]
MKSLVILAVLFVGLNIVQADRPKTKQVLSSLNNLRPRYREIQDFVINTLADARLNSSSKINVFHQDVLMVKETFVVQGILKEDALLFQINNQPKSVDSICLSFVQTLVDSFINLAGTSYSNCITDVGEQLNGQVIKFYGELQQDETEYLGIGLLDVFKGENIYNDPDRIQAKLADKTYNLEQYPEHMKWEMYDLVHAFGKNLDSLSYKYIDCMTDGEQLLNNGFSLAYTHMDTTCKAVAIPPPSADVESTGPEYEAAASLPMRQRKTPQQILQHIHQKLGL